MKHLLLISCIILHALQPLQMQANDEIGDSWIVPATLIGATAFVFTLCQLQLQKRNVTQLKAQITQLQANKAEQDKNVTALTTANDEKTQTIASLKDNLVTKEKAVKTLLRFSLLQGSLAKSKQQK